MQKRKLIIAPLLLSLLTLFSCNKEDDIETIFVGRTWYMNGATINGLKLNSDIKNFYTEAGDASEVHYPTMSPSLAHARKTASVRPSR